MSDDNKTVWFVVDKSTGKIEPQIVCFEDENRWKLKREFEWRQFAIVPVKQQGEIERLQAALKAALKAARKAAKKHGIGSRDFAAMCGISAKQLSDWTEDKITTQPDFVD